MLAKNLKYYGLYQLTYVVIVVLLSSIGAFFHFLLNHEISIVESWLHHNQWEILIISKLISLFLINRWFSMRMYQLKTLRELVKELVHWPEPKSIVVPIFMSLSFLVLDKFNFHSENLNYWYFHFISFVGISLFYGIEFVVIAHLDDVLNQKEQAPRLPLAIGYTLIFALSFKMSVPDYYGLLPFVVVCFASLIILSGVAFRSWSNVVCFVLLFIAPMAAVFGLDPVWGHDFSPFKLERKFNLALLLVIWMISFGYYKFRDQLLISARKLIR